MSLIRVFFFVYCLCNLSLYGRELRKAPAMTRRTSTAHILDAEDNAGSDTKRSQRSIARNGQMRRIEKGLRSRQKIDADVEKKKIKVESTEDLAVQKDILQQIESTELLDTIIKKEEIKQEKKATKQGRAKRKQRKEKQVVDLVDDQAIYLNFEKIKLSSFINYIATQRKMNLIPDKATESVEISIAIREPLTLDGAWQVFLTMLEMYGFTMVEIGPEGNKSNVYKVVPRATKNFEPLPSYIGTPLNQLPDSDLTIRYIAFLQNISVNEVTNLLASMLGPDSRLIPQPNINGFIITDKILNIKSGMRVIQELDQSGLQETVVVRRLQRANARDVKFLLERLISSPEASPLARLLGKKAEGSLEYFSSTTKIVEEERSNSLILLGNHKSIKVIEDFIDRYFEKEERFTKSPLKVFTFKYAEAAQIRDLLSEVVVSSGDSAAAKVGGVLGGVKYFKNMNFQVDERGNQLIVSCADPRDWKILKPTLKSLDTAQPSVVIETLIVSVNAEDEKALGGQIRPPSGSTLGTNIGFQSAGLASGIIPQRSNGENVSLLGNLLEAVSGFGRGSTVVSFGNKNQPGSAWAVFRALKSETNASVISQPFITVANRVKAVIEAGDSRRIVKEEAVSDTGSISSNTARSYTDQEALTHIEYTPHINLDGIINLQVDATIADFQGDDGKQEKILKTNVSVASGQVLVLGGFIKTTLNQDEGGTPFLSKIPIFGWLFKNKNRSIAKQYIFIFVCPTIIKPRQTPGADLYTKMKLHKAHASVESAIDTKRSKDPIHNWFFNPDGETYAHKVIDFATARYQPTLVDIKNDPEYRSNTEIAEKKYGADYNPLDVKPEELPPVEKLYDKTHVLNAEIVEEKNKKRDPILEQNREHFKKTVTFDDDESSERSFVADQQDNDEEDAVLDVLLKRKKEEEVKRSKRVSKKKKDTSKKKVVIDQDFGNDSRNRLKNLLSMGHQKPLLQSRARGMA